MCIVKFRICKITLFGDILLTLPFQNNDDAKVFRLFATINNLTARGWEDIAARGEEPRAIASSGFYPLIGITACTVFIQRFYVSSLSLVTMIQNAVVTFVQYFVTFFFAVFLFSFFLKRMVDGEPNEKKYTTFILYNLGLLAVINIIGNCLPPIDLSIVQFLPVVVVLVTWMGMRYLAVRATSSFAFTALECSEHPVASLYTRLFVSFYNAAIIMNLKNSKDINIKNKRATFDYAISDTFTAGIVLTGTEIKSIRLGKASLADSFCYVTNGEVWLKNMYIAEYFYGTYNNHAERRDRKLLLNKKEIAKLEKNGKEAGFTIIPMRLFINDRGLAKVVIGIGRGKKEYDKRQSIKEREDKRSMARLFEKR